jgi:FtsH-binding integral membrane protein
MVGIYPYLLGGDLSPPVRMAGCPNFIGLTYLHLALASVASAFLSQYDVLGKAGIDMKKWYNLLILFIVTIVLLLMLVKLKPGPLKYIVFGLFIFCIGTSLRDIAERLKQKDLLLDVLATVSSVFVAMTALGFYDKQNILGFGAYLFAGLIGLLLARLGLGVANLAGAPTATLSTLNQGLSAFATLLFSIYLAYDTQMLKKMAAECKSNPDYIDGSISLYLDIINLFANIGDLFDS